MSEEQDVRLAHCRGYLQALVSLLLQTRTPIGPMRDRKDYPPELADAIRYLHSGSTDVPVAAEKKPNSPVKAPFIDFKMRFKKDYGPR